MTKRNQILMPRCVFVGGSFYSGMATVIGKRPNSFPSLPYVNINDAQGRLVVSIEHVEMNRLVKMWVKAWGGEPK